jgi:hypothetical protein
MSSTPVAAELMADADLEPGIWLEEGNNRLRRRKIAQLRERHWTMLVISALVIVASLALELRPTGHVAASWLPIAEFPPLCGSRALLGVECPGCGLTRSFIALAHGEVEQSLRFHRLGWLMALAVVLQIPYRLFALSELRTRIADRAWPNWVGYGLIAALLLNWLLLQTA